MLEVTKETSFGHMRLLHVITGLGSGGAENMLVKLIAALPAPRFEHIVVPLVSGGTMRGAAEAAGARIIDFRMSRSLQGALALRRLRRIVDDVAPDVVQGWMYHGNFAAAIAAGGRPVVWNVRQTLDRLGDNKLLTAAIILACMPLAGRVGRVIYNSSQAALQHERYGYPAGKRLLIPNGFDLAQFRPSAQARVSLRAALGLPAEALVVGRVARDAAMKDHATLFDAFSRILAALPEVHLVCVGHGMTADAPSLRALVDAHGAGGRVHLLGERPDIADLTAGFDIALSSSAHSEGFSNAIAEAMACGVPVVATDVGEARDIIGDTSRVVAPRWPPGRSLC
jgi:glycosyltransferase involved in cell wall biosynthesis